MSRAGFQADVGAGLADAKSVAGLGAPAYLVAYSTLLTWKHGVEAAFTVLDEQKPLFEPRIETALAKRVLPRL